MKRFALSLLFVLLLVGISQAQVEGPGDPPPPPPWPVGDDDPRYQIEGMELNTVFWIVEDSGLFPLMVRGGVANDIRDDITTARESIIGSGWATWGSSNNKTFDLGEWVDVHGIPVYYYVRGATYWYYTPKE